MPMSSLEVTHIQSFLHIFIGPQVAYGSRGSRATRKGNAAAHDIGEVSLNAIAYSATIVRFLIHNPQCVR